MDTTHSFIPSQLNALLCARCYQSESSHGNAVECQACNSLSKLTLANSIWLCETCLSKELEVIPTPVDTDKDKRESLPNKLPFTVSAISYIGNELSKDHTPIEKQNEALNALGSQAISNSEDFFNANTKAIDNRRLELSSDSSKELITQVMSKSNCTEIEAVHYQLAKEVREHYLHLKEKLFKVNTEQLEVSTKMRSNQVYLNTLASKLREEFRVQLHLQNLDYTPPTPSKTKPKTIKLSKDDALAEMYANLMNIPIETAKRLIANKLRSEGLDCTCKETPGICRFHSLG